MAGNKFTGWLLNQWRNNPLFSTALALAVMVVLQTVALGFDFATFGDWWNAFVTNWIIVLRNNSTAGIVALGMAFVIISGGIDLSVGSTFAAVGALFLLLIDGNGLLAQIGLGGWPAFAVALLAVVLAGALLGGLNGICVADGAIPPFIVTLGTMKIFRSVTQHLMQGRNPVFPAEFEGFSCLTIGGHMLMPIFYWLLVSALLYVVSRRTVFGNHVIAVGSNERAAQLSGIGVEQVKRMVYVLSGALAAFAAVIQICRIGSMDYSNAGSGYEMDAIAAVIVGGTRMTGGRGSVIGTMLGVLIIAVMNNLLNLLGVPPFLREAFKGVVVVAAVLLQRKEKA
jgi:ribose transport system permease protein